MIAEPQGFNPKAVAVLEAQADVVLEALPPGGLSEAVKEFDAVWFRLAHKVDKVVLGEKPRCRVLATAVTGIDHIDVEACRAVGVRVVSLKGEVEFLKEVRATAELTIGLAMALMRQLPAAANSVLYGAWARDKFRGHELYKKTVGLIGVGRLGSIVAGYFQALGCEVLGYDIRADFPLGVRRCATLEQLLVKSDVVSVHVSYDASTHGLLGARQFAAMKPGAFFINTSRGGVVDEAALLNALESGQLRGAAVDVLSGEPNIDLQHPVVAYAKTHTNLLVVPHIGGNTVESFEKTELFIAGKVLEALR